MIVNTFITDVNVLFSAEVTNLIRKHGPDPMLVHYWFRAIALSHDGSPIASAEAAELLTFYTGLDIEQIERCLNILIEANLLQKTRENFIISETLCSDLQKVINKRETYRKNVLERWIKLKENKGLDTMVIQSDTNLQNTEHRTQNIRSVSNKKDLKMISIRKFQEDGKIQSRKFQNLWFTREEFEKLKENYSQDEMVLALELLNSYPESNLNAYKKFWSYLSHYRTVIGWPLDEARRKLKITLELAASEKKLEFYNK